MNMTTSCGKRPALREERGISLVEVLAALVIALVIISTGFTAFIIGDKATRANDLVADTQQNARLAMELVSRDIRVAGFGMVAPVGACTVGGGTAAAIVPVDNNAIGADTGPDSVRLVVPVTNNTTAPQWTLSAARAGSFTTIDLQAGAVGTLADPTSMVGRGLAGGSTVSVGGVASGTVLAAAGDTVTFNAGIGGTGAQFPAGTQVYLLQCVTYSVGAAAGCAGLSTCLLRDGVPMVDGIEDLQLAYACDGCDGSVPDGTPDDMNPTGGTFEIGDFVTDTNGANPWGVAPVTPETIRLVRINIVARQVWADQGIGEANVTGVNTAAALIVSDHDHLAGVLAAGDYNAAQYLSLRRRQLSRTVQPRNMGS